MLLLFQNHFIIILALLQVQTCTCIHRGFAYATRPWQIITHRIQHEVSRPGAYAERIPRGVPGQRRGTRGSGKIFGILVLQMAILLLDFDHRYSLDEHVMPLLSIPYAKESF